MKKRDEDKKLARLEVAALEALKTLCEALSSEGEWTAETLRRNKASAAAIGAFTRAYEAETKKALKGRKVRIPHWTP